MTNDDIDRPFAVLVVSGPLIYRISIEDGAVSEWHWTVRSADSIHNED